MKEIWQFFFVHLYISQCMDFGKKKQNEELISVIFIAHGKIVWTGSF